MTGHSEHGVGRRLRGNARRSAMARFQSRVRDVFRVLWLLAALTAIALVGEAGRRWA
jgi:hypothetical protein